MNRFFRMDVKTRITLGLVCILLSVLSAAMFVGMYQGPQAAIRDGRAHLCETLTLISSDYITQGRSSRLDDLLRAVVARNEDLKSAGVRREDGRLLSSFGAHEENWPVSDSMRSTETHVRVPIRKGQVKWGSVELCFQPLQRAEWWGVVLESSTLMLLFVSSGCFLLFNLYLKKMLAHLDPSKTVPKRVRNALDTLAEGLLLVDRQQRIVLANHAFAGWMGQSPDQLMGLKADRLPWSSDSGGQAPWSKALETENVITGQMIELRVDGKLRALNANASPVMGSGVIGSGGKCLGVIVSFDDVTQLEETKRDLTVAKRAADDANQAKSEFLARMSHEIRTPMNAILGYTDVLRRGFDTSIEDRQEYLDTIHGSGEHLLALINDILDLSKVESGQLELEQGPCSIHQIMKEVVALLRSKADEKGIRLEFHGDGLLPREFTGDSVRLRQAIMNLAGNAIKFTDEGSVDVTARVEKERGQAVMLEIDVSDTGIGISKEAQQKVFEPFAQADTSITRRFGGTGLGLAISKQLAEAMGGEVGLESEQGKGSTFTIRFPVGIESELEFFDPKELSGDKSQKHQQVDVQTLPNCRILVADDGSPNRKLMRVVLGKAGAEVVTVENGKLAVEAALDQEFDIILMDMQMPVMDGYTATSTLRESGYERPIFALTANAMQGDQENCLAAGCSGFLTKPIQIDRLLETLAKELQSRPTNNRPTWSTPVRVAHETSHLQRESEPDTAEVSVTSDSQKVIRCSYPLDDPEFLEIAEDFVRVLRERLTVVKGLIETRDFDSIASQAHWLKGVSGSAGYQDFAQPSTSLQHAAEHQDFEACERLFRSIETLASRIDLVAQLADSPASRLDDVNKTAATADALVSSLPMDDDDFRDVVIDFASRLDGKFNAMELALEREDWQTLGQLAHWLKGTSGTVGFAEFTAPTAALEKVSQANNAEAAKLAIGDLRKLAGRIQVPC
ncbi:MAG: ATP-binding protein [Planctomycetota bacterium]